RNTARAVETDYRPDLRLLGRGRVLLGGGLLTTLLARRLLRSRARRGLFSRRGGLLGRLRFGLGRRGRLLSRLRGLLSAGGRLLSRLRGRLRGRRSLLGGVLGGTLRMELGAGDQHQRGRDECNTLHLERPPEVGICPWVCPLIRSSEPAVRTNGSRGSLGIPHERPRQSNRRPI